MNHPSEVDGDVRDLDAAVTTWLRSHPTPPDRTEGPDHA